MNIVKRIDKNTEKEIRTSFLEKLGVRIRISREKQNISQESLGSCLDLNSSTISRIETGTTDTPVSNLQMISLYCKFPLSDLFKEDESKAFLNAFANAVEITAKKYSRRKKKSDKTLKGRIYDVNGKEVVEFVPIRSDITRREKYKQGLVEVSEKPYSPEEFYQVFADDNNKDTVNNVIKAGELLNNIKDIPGNATIKNALSRFIIDEVGVGKGPVSEEERERRIYAYYKTYLEQYKYCK